MVGGGRSVVGGGRSAVRGGRSAAGGGRAVLALCGRRGPGWVPMGNDGRDRHQSHGPQFRQLFVLHCDE